MVIMRDAADFELLGRPVAGMQRARIRPAELRWLWKSLRQLDFFKGLPKDFFRKLAPAVSLWLFPADRIVVEEDTESDGLFLLYQGRVVVSRFSPGRDCSLTVKSLLPGDVFGEIALLERCYRTATVTTTDASAIFVIQADQFRAILEENPDIKRHLRRIAQERKLDLMHYA
jgi:CRP-like cAMP-binding protein